MNWLEYVILFVLGAIITVLIILWMRSSYKKED